MTHFTESKGEYGASVADISWDIYVFIDFKQGRQTVDKHFMTQKHKKKPEKRKKTLNEDEISEVLVVLTEEKSSS